MSGEISRRRLALPMPARIRTGKDNKSHLRDWNWEIVVGIRIGRGRGLLPHRSVIPRMSAIAWQDGDADVEQMEL